jgi:hypothetical protein
MEQKLEETVASSDLVATADNGDQTHNFTNCGINSSTYSVSAYNSGGPDDGYCLTTGNLFVGAIGSAKIVTIGAGGATTGRVTSGTTGTCTFTVTMGGGITSQHGWECAMHNRTTPANVINESGVGTSSTVVFTGTTVSGDVLSFSCVGIQ